MPDEAPVTSASGPEPALVLEGDTEDDWVGDRDDFAEAFEPTRQSAEAAVLTAAWAAVFFASFVIMKSPLIQFHLPKRCEDRPKPTNAPQA